LEIRVGLTKPEGARLPDLRLRLEIFWAARISRATWRSKVRKSLRRVERPELKVWSFEPKSLNKEERDETSTAVPSVWASVEATGAGAAGVTGASVLEVLEALAGLVAGAGTGTGAVAGTVLVADAEAGEEVFFAILLLVYTIM